MNKRFLSLGLALVLVLSLVACGGGEDADTPEVQEGDVEATELKIGMVTDEGGVNDQSFNQSAWEGLERVAEELGIETDYQESEHEADFEPNFETLLDQDFDMMWGVGYKLADATMEAALSNPEKVYGIIDFSYEDNEDYPDGTPENVMGILFRDEQSSFLAGYVAGRTTESDKVGFVGGIEGNVIWKFEHGYKAGVQYAAKELGKDIEVMVQYADSFSDTLKGKSIATSMFQNGADIVAHAAGAVGDGVIEAAKEQDKWAIGVDRDQNYLAPDNVLTSVMKRVDVAIFNASKAFKEGNFEGGSTVTYGLADDGAVGLAPTTDKNVDAEILEDVKLIEQEIVAGNIEVPRNAEEYEEYLTTLK